MDCTIYIDNARGFRDCRVPLSGLSFLVGQNSSGKSSFLGLSHLLLSEDFWVHLGFSDKWHDLGGFDDLISKVSQNRADFTLGAYARKSKGGKGFGAVVTFSRLAGEHRATRCTFLHGRHLVSFYLNGREYFWVDHGMVSDDQDMSSDEFMQRIVKGHRGFKRGAGNAIGLTRRSSDKYLLLAASHAIKREIENIYGDEAEADNELLPSESLINGVWFAPIRAEPRRIYESASEVGFSPVGSHTPFLLRELIKKRKREGFEKSASRMLESFGKGSGLFDDLEVKSFGRSSSAPFTLSVRLNDASFHLGEVGYGVSQVLPIVAEMYASVGVGGFFMQQPEVHLHPKAQAEIGNVLYIYTTAVENCLLIVETHSDYLIDRFRTLVREDFLERAKLVDASILWFSREDAENKVHRIDIDSNGALPESIPDGYREFFLTETMRGLGLNVDN